MTFRPRPSTFSIVGHDAANRELGIAVASKFLSVGAVVPWARAGVGAVATQAAANTGYGPDGLALMEQGGTAREALDALLARDEERDHRQVGLVDHQGRSATFSGRACYHWAGGRAGTGYAAQGNILTGPEVVDRMAESFEASNGALADRLLAALAAGQEAGGDSRGQQSAALLVVKPAGGYGGFNDRYIDLRIDDHGTPIVELERLLAMHRLYMFETQPEDVLDLDPTRTAELQTILRRAGQYSGQVNGNYDELTRTALRALSDRENLEGRWRADATIDRVVLDYLRQTYSPDGK